MWRQVLVGCCGFHCDPISLRCQNNDDQSNRRMCFHRSLPPPHAGCPRGNPGPLPVLTRAILNPMTTLPEQIEAHRDRMWHRDEDRRVESLWTPNVLSKTWA